MHGPRAPGMAGGLAALVAPVLVVPMLVGAIAVFVHVPSARPAETGDDPYAATLLRQSAAVGDQVSYSGTQYVSTWSALAKSASSSSAIVQVRHAAGGQTEIALHDDQTAILQGRTAASWLAGDGPVDLLLDAYDVRLAGSGTVAGRPADIVEARRDDGSVAVRLWLDRETALSLRRESFAHDGYPLSASAFVDVTIGDAETCCAVDTTETAETAIGTEGQAAMLHWSDIERLRDEGWHCPEILSDGMVLYEARRVGEAIQLSYSDGVMTVSVFEQRGRLDPVHLEGYSTVKVDGGVVYTRPGPPARLTWTSNGHVITVVAEAPLKTVESLIDHLPPEQVAAPREPDDGFFARIGRGAQRVGSWLNPFD